MLCRVTLAMAVVCVGGMCNGVQVNLMSRLNIPRDYGVKLCGREFIRAVIFTCGGSRWRRSTEGDLVPFQWRTLSDVTLEDGQHSWKRVAKLPADPSPLGVASSYSLADLLALYRQQRSQSGPSPLPPLGPGERDGTPADEPTRTQRKRNFSMGVAGKCCNHGCTKYDIGRLC